MPGTQLTVKNGKFEGFLESLFTERAVNFLFFLNRVNSLYYYIFKKSYVVATAGSWVLCTRHSGVGFHKMVSEFLIGRLGEHGLFPEVGGQVAVDPGDGIKGDLGKVAQGGSAAPG
jgi:hypothetical protein